MKFLAKMERKFGKYAITGLTRYIIMFYVIGYLFQLLYQVGVFPVNIIGYLTLEPVLILQGQVWRLITWLLIPPSSIGIFTIIMLFFYYSIGNTLERTWGAFLYNVYIIGGLLFSVIGAFLCYGISILIYGMPMYGIGAAFSTYYVSMSIMLAFAATYPDMEIMLYFVLPIKMKWMGLVYAAFIVYDCIYMSWAGRIAVVASLFNFVLFFLLTRNFKRVSPKEIKRKKQFKKAVNQAAPQPGQPRHKCAVCGRTDLDHPELEFRYCSKCNGSYEYCQDHLFTHKHVE